MVDRLISPLDHLAGELEQASTERVRVAEIPFLAQLSLRIDPESAESAETGAALGVSLPRQPNTLARGEDVDVFWLAPDEWLVVGAPGEQVRLAKLLCTAIGNAFGSVVDVSAQRTTVALTGPDAADVLAAGCSLDLDPEVFTEQGCAQTMLAHAPVLLWRRLGGFAVAVRASFADYLARWLLDALDGLGPLAEPAPSG